MTMPGVQKPHCTAPASRNERWMTCSIVSFARFSIVSTLFPASVLRTVTHERARIPSMSTLHAPQ